MLIYLAPSRTGLSNEIDKPVATKTIKLFIPMRLVLKLRPPIADEKCATFKVFQANNLYLSVNDSEISLYYLNPLFKKSNNGLTGDLVSSR